MLSPRAARRRRITLGGLAAGAVDLAALALVVFVTFRLYTIATASPLPFEPYLSRSDGSRADPVNIVFESAQPGIDSSRAATTVQNVLGWYEVAGEPMSFTVAGARQATAYQFGLDLGGGARIHLRIAAVTADDRQIHVLAAVHRDEPAGCGHVGRAFDESRDQVAAAFRTAGYSVTQLDLGNAASGRHCDASQTPGDGKAIVIRLSDVP